VSWQKVAAEGESFAVGGSQSVRYGSGSSWIQKTVAGAGQCTTSFFGSDPAYGVVKECQAPAGSAVPVPTVTLGAQPASVTAGGSTTLSWSAANATSCTASGAWSGTKPTTGSEQTAALTATSTYTLTCAGTAGSGTQSLTVVVTGTSGGAVTGLNFPSNGDTSADVRFRFTGANLLPAFPATYIWRVNPRQQSGYYTTFFWGPDGPFTATGFYGAHPYPAGEPKGSSRAHNWEVSIEGTDVVNAVGGVSTAVDYGRWHTQALVVRQVSVGGFGELETNFYYDLPDTSKRISYTTHTHYAGTFPPANPALVFGDAPWARGGERLSGILRGLQLYSTALSLADILAESNTPLSTSAGAANIWYLNQNPTPGDISDKSGRGHHPEWVSATPASPWTGP
jgi:hypothetical protein